MTPDEMKNLIKKCMTGFGAFRTSQARLTTSAVEGKADFSAGPADFRV